MLDGERRALDALEAAIDDAMDMFAGDARRTLEVRLHLVDCRTSLRRAEFEAEKEKEAS
jgi:hypothetical protein